MSLEKVRVFAHPIIHDIIDGVHKGRDGDNGKNGK